MGQLTQQEIGGIYTVAARWYDVWMTLLEFVFLRGLRGRLLQNARRRALEVGVGTGMNLKHYPRECEITGIDYTPAMLERAKKRAAKLDRKVILKQGDARRLPFKKESFDTIVDTLCLCTYPQPVSVLREMKRVCKKGGQILLLEHGRSSNKIIEKLQCWRAGKHYQSMGCHLLRDHEDLAKKAGLKIVESKRAFFGVFYLMRAKR